MIVLNRLLSLLTARLGWGDSSALGVRGGLPSTLGAGCTVTLMSKSPHWLSPAGKADTLQALFNNSQAPPCQMATKISIQANDMN